MASPLMKGMKKLMLNTKAAPKGDVQPAAESLVKKPAETVMGKKKKRMMLGR